MVSKARDRTVVTLGLANRCCQTEALRRSRSSALTSNMSQHQPAFKSYVLITVAHNEEAYIERLISSVIKQTLLPSKWLIVSDGSIDRTNEIVGRYATDYPFIHLLHLARIHSREFASKVHALNKAAECMRSENYAFIGHVDADVSFDATYFGSLLDKFQKDVGLGVAGGFICEQEGGEFKPRRTNSVRSVAGAVQMFRRVCYESIGGFLPLKCGGEDWHAEVSARMKGWRVLAFPELKVYHHRPTGAVGGIVRSCYRQGIMDYCVGCHPLFEIIRVIRRLRARPFVLGAAVRLLAFALSYCRRERRPVSPEFVEFLRAEQKARLWPFRTQGQQRSEAVCGPFRSG